MIRLIGPEDQQQFMSAARRSFMVFYKFYITQVCPVESIDCKALGTPWREVTKLLPPPQRTQAPITPPVLTAIPPYRTAAMAVRPRAPWTAGAEWMALWNTCSFQSCLQRQQLTRPTKAIGDSQPFKQHNKLSHILSKTCTKLVTFE
jgi:hypothetical protein